MPVFICQGCGTELTEWSGQCPKCGVSETIRINQSADRMIDKVIKGRYKIVRKLGQGGMGAVYLAEQQGIGHRVALKFLKAEFSDDADLTKRFLNEAKTYARVAHPNAVTFHDFGQDDDGNLFIAMEYCEGVDLKKLLFEKKRLPLPEAIDITLQVADVLGNAHSKGIVHRDLKPENIMLRIGLRGIHVKVLDFGIARLMNEKTKLTMQGAIAGTPRYMSPEQVEGKVEVDHRADIYAIGILLYEMLTGVQPIDGMTIAEILRKQVAEPMPHLSKVSPDLEYPEVDAVIQKATAKDREERYPDMMSLASVLAQAMPTQAGKLGSGLYPGGYMASGTPPPYGGVTPPPTQNVLTPPTQPANAAETAATFMRPPTQVEKKELATGNFSIGGINPASTGAQTQHGTPEDASQLAVPQKSKAPLFVGLALVLIAGGVGGWYAFKPAPPSIVVTPPPDPLANNVKPPDPKPPDEVKPPDSKLPGINAPADPNLDEVTVSRGRDFWARAQTLFAVGNLDEAETFLEGVPANTPQKADAEAMIAKIAEIHKRVRAGDAARLGGNCAAAVPNYQAALKLNGKVGDASRGISQCNAAAIPGTIE
ncbi:MAG: protein kinase [Myxococcaceae bacterium]